MSKIEAVLYIVPLVVSYFMISGERLVDFKVFTVWFALIVLTGTQIHSIYQLSTNTEMEFWVRYAALNISSIGLLVLLGTILFVKKYLRDELLSKMTRA